MGHKGTDAFSIFQDSADSAGFARRRRVSPFFVSLGLHALAVAWVAFAPPVPAGIVPYLYERRIFPSQEHIIWYKLADRLPDIRPAPPRSDPRPPRARKQFEQTIVAGARDDSRPPQLIYAPAPEIRAPKPLPLPNLVSVARPPPRLFTPPVPAPPPPRTLPKLADAPQLAPAHAAGELPIATTPARPQPLPFHAPPPPPRQDQPALTLPAAPEFQPVAAGAALPSVLANARRGFVAPPRAPAPPAAPQPIAADAPAAIGPAAPDLAIAGLAPVAAPEIPTPPGSQSAAFSAGPKPRPTGGDSSGAALEVPGLLVEGGAKDAKPVLVAHASPTSQESLAAAIRAAHDGGGVPPAPPPARPATRVSAAPDPRLEGRVVYTMAVQMPNITSYSGSWMVWFAEHEAPPGRPPQDVQPPVPIRKVDPKYIPSAIQERVEGKVRLWAVIGKDGHLSSVTLLSHLDDRLDRSALEALSKWIFQPAMFNGNPIEVDAVFEVPFRLAPKPKR